ncbi:MAG: GH25 family lysozyme [Propionicimonas sp.]|uniref:GH25 family lysozyme n=1 Tax=Propionicimonas sp. TaxID=1955623 RepID=UPI003D0E1B2A
MPRTKARELVTHLVKRIPKAVAVALFGSVMAACTLSTPSPSQAAGAPAAHAVGGVLAATALPAAVVQTSITSEPSSAKVGKYGTTTVATFAVKAAGTSLAYKWQHRAGSGSAWKSVSGATSRTYKARASVWASGTQFRVVVTGKLGKDVSKTVTLTVLKPTKTPAKDAEKAFGLTGLTQGVDLSAYQYTPSAKIDIKAVAEWAGDDGFTLLRLGSGARPIAQSYVDACTNKTKKMGAKPVTQDCAYARLADKATAAGLSLGHYWFNGWIDSIDTTKKQLFAGGYTTEDSAKQFVAWLKADGHYTKASTDPLVLDIEAGHAWTRTYNGKTYTKKLRAWNPEEAAAFLTAVRTLLTDAGYHANLYVYMSANAASKMVDGAYYWQDVAPLARLWVASWGTDNGRIPAAQPKVGPWADYDGWSIWQYTSNARFSGSGVGALDGDIAASGAWTVR